MADMKKGMGWSIVGGLMLVFSYVWPTVISMIWHDASTLRFWIVVGPLVLLWTVALFYVVDKISESTYRK